MVGWTWGLTGTLFQVRCAQRDCRNMPPLKQEQDPLEDRGWCRGVGREQGDGIAG